MICEIYNQPNHLLIVISGNKVVTFGPKCPQILTIKTTGGQPRAIVFLLNPQKKIEVKLHYKIILALLLSKLIRLSTQIYLLFAPALLTSHSPRIVSDHITSHLKLVFRKKKKKKKKICVSCVD